MYLVTVVRKQLDADEDNPEEMVERVVERTSNVMHGDEVDALMQRIQAGDHRVLGCRVFELSVGDDGVPSIGGELG